MSFPTFRTTLQGSCYHLILKMGKSSSHRGYTVSGQELESSTLCLSNSTFGVLPRALFVNSLVLDFLT